MDASLAVSRAEFLAAFDLLRKLCQPRPSEEAILSFDGACLHIDLGGMTVTPGARGEWPGQARVAANVVMALAKVPLKGEAIEFRVKGGEVRVGTTVARCVWQAEWSARIALAENASKVHVLCLPFRWPQADVKSAGLAGVLEDAEKWKNALVRDALAVLRELGVTEMEVRELADRALFRQQTRCD